MLGARIYQIRLLSFVRQPRPSLRANILRLELKRTTIVPNLCHEFLKIQSLSPTLRIKVPRLELFLL